MRAVRTTGMLPARFWGRSSGSVRRAALVLVFAALLCAKHALASDAMEACRIVIEDDEVATVFSVGDFTYLYHADGSYAVYQRVGDMSVISDSLPGRSGMAYHAGDTMVILRESSVSHCRLLGGVMYCHRQHLQTEQDASPDRMANAKGLAHATIHPGRTANLALGSDHPR